MGTRGGIRHPCQPREISCPVPARIMDREISWGFTMQQPGVFFSRARGKLYTLVGHVLPSDQRRTQHQSLSCSTDTPQTDHVWNERFLPACAQERPGLVGDTPTTQTLHGSSREQGSGNCTLCITGDQVYKQPLYNSLGDTVIVLFGE
jgi:hypothetical protein